MGRGDEDGRSERRVEEEGGGVREDVTCTCREVSGLDYHVHGWTRRTTRAVPLRRT